MTKRFYDGAPTNKHAGEAAQMKKQEMQKGGKLPMTSKERYKKIIDKKMETHRLGGGFNPRSMSTIPGAGGQERKMSARAEEALKMMAQKKAAKEAKALRQRVVIKPQFLQGAGRIEKSGRVYDLGGFVTLKINAKTGQIKASNGAIIGKYNHKSAFNTTLMSDALKKHGLYFQKLQMLQKQQEAERLAEMYAQSGNMYGPAGQLMAMQLYGAAEDSNNNSGGGSGWNGMAKVDAHGNSMEPNRGGVGASAWGAMSNNVHGTFVDNVWGGMADNVWGGVSSNIWGGVGGHAFGNGSAWKIWGSGKPGQKNFLKPFKGLFIGMFGFGIKWGKGSKMRYRAPKARMGGRR